jgi:methionine aminotransferase
MEKPQGSLISYFSSQVRKQGGINLAQGKPGFSPPAELVERLVAASRLSHLHQYAPGIGNQQLMEYLVSGSGGVLSLGVENLLVVQGATEGLFLAFFYLQKQLNRPFSVLSFDPVYESYPKLAAYFDLPFQYFKLDEDNSVDFFSLKKICSQKLVKIIFLASPGNPLGKVWDENEIGELIEFCEHMGIYIIFDAVYKDIYFNEPPYNPLVLDSPNLFYVGSFSKMLSITGWRVGYIFCQRKPMIRLRAIHDYIGLCAPSLEQQAIADFLISQKGGLDYIQRIRSTCQTNYTFMKVELQSTGFDVSDIEGGYFVWARVPDHYPGGYELAWELLKGANVGVVPGENFSLTQTDFIRLNIATDFKILEQAIKKIKNCVQM